ncbi:RagB/SusD family nutrient uptake outer membrane protein [Longimonas halophila]|nr:RagB/SusD family nutrient uptake outer membrane protein [Longimonas halophila]
MTMQRFAYNACFVLLLAATLAACDFFDPGTVTNPNSPSTEAVLSGASQSELQNLVTGLEDRHRNAPPAVTELYGSFGREVYAAFASDPRFVTNWLGQEGVTPDAEFFADGSAFDTPYAAIKQGNFLIEAVNNTDAVDDQERNGYIGFAKTIQAYQYLIALNGQWRGPDRNPPGSIRIDVADPLNPGPFLGYDEALAEIRGLLDEAYAEIGNAGDSFAFTLSEGFAGFDTPTTMRELNRAIAARAAIYAEDWPGALDALDNSFLSLTPGEASMNEGAYHVFGSPPDQFNPLFYPRNANTNQILMVHPSMIDDALPGDLRVERKFFERNEPITNGDLPGVELFYQDNRYESNESPIPFMRNEELILIHAEAQAQTGNLGEAVDAIDIIRETWELNTYDGPVNEEALIDEILFQRRYSLWAEGGHRWIDARRYDRLDAIPTELDGGQVFEKLARPLSER